MSNRIGRQQQSAKPWLAVLTSLPLLGFACSLPASQNLPGSTPVILISVDTLRADHLSCYGYHRYSTPVIDSLARRGTLFTQIDSQIPLTLPSHTSLLSSTYPFVNGIEENGEKVPPGMITLATVLKSRGYRTAAFIGGFFLARRFGLDQGFEVYDGRFGSSDDFLMKALDLKRPAGEVTRSAMKWLEQNSRGPFFLFLHLFDLHRPYDPPPEYLTRDSADEYDAELGYVDDVLGEFRAFLTKTGLFENSLIVFTSDHGESLGDHGESTHGYFVYQSTLHVPLIIHWPEGTGPYAAKMDAPAGLIDVAPTIVQAVGLPLPSSFQGRSLLGFLDHGTAGTEREVYSESLYARDNFRCAPLRSLRTGKYQCIVAPKPELYDLERDPGEIHNLAASEGSVAQALENRLFAFWSQYHVSTPARRQSVSRDVVAKLRALGYVAVSGPRQVPDESGVDPKDRLMEYRQYLRATRLAQTGRFSEAEATFQEILDGDPDNLTAHFDLASIYVKRRRYYDALKHLHAALAIDPYNVSAEELIGTVWLDSRNYPRARAEFKHILSFEPRDYPAEYGLGVIAMKQGRLNDSVRHFRAAADIRPKSAEAHNAFGNACFELGRFTQAEEEFEKATGFKPDFAEAHYNMGRIFELQKRKPEAAEEYRRALKYDPELTAARRALKHIGLN